MLYYTFRFLFIRGRKEMVFLHFYKQIEHFNSRLFLFYQLALAFATIVWLFVDFRVVRLSSNWKFSSQSLTETKVQHLQEITPYVLYGEVFVLFKTGNHGWFWEFLLYCWSYPHLYGFLLLRDRAWYDSVLLGLGNVIFQGLSFIYQT